MDKDPNVQYIEDIFNLSKMPVGKAAYDEARRINRELIQPMVDFQQNKDRWITHVLFGFVMGVLATAITVSVFVV